MKRKKYDNYNNSVENAPVEEDNSDCDSNANSIEEDELGNEEIEEEAQPEDIADEIAPTVHNIEDEIMEQVNDLRSGNVYTVLKTEFPEFKVLYRYVLGPILPPNIDKSPVSFLELSWNEEIMNIFVLNTNAYARAAADPKWRKDMTKDRLYVFFGVSLHLGTISVPERRSLWDISSKYYCRFVHEVMSCDEFESILRNLHWINTLQYSVIERNAMNRDDCFWRVATLLDKLALSFQRHFHCGQNIDGDEQGIPCKGRHSAIQYNKDKPYKWFFKVYALNDAETAYMSNFYLFRGKDVGRTSDVSASAYPIYYLTRPEMYHNKWNSALQ